MTRVAWFHCFSGISGDMALGSLLDAGADADAVAGIVSALPVEGWQLEPSPTMRCGLGATYAGVRASEDGVVRTAGSIEALIGAADLPPRVRERSLAVFARLADVEGALHRRPPSQVHFHEVGGLDAIVDVVGTCAALEVLDVDEVRASPVATGTGMVRSAHGLLPNPAPAVVALLRGAPTYGRDTTVELTTPTGAAILSALVPLGGYGPMPAMVASAVGYGAGARELDGMPNVVQVVVGEAAERDRPQRGQPMTLLEASVDDVTGEVLGHAVAALLEAGAADAWITPVVMKKGRPGHLVAALCDPALAESLTAVLAAETGSFGVRSVVAERWASPRQVGLVDVAGQPVRVKVGPGRAKAEFDDAMLAARATGRPVREVVSLAEEAWRRRDEPDPAG